MRLAALLATAILAPTLLAAQPATPLVTTDDRTAPLGALLESQVLVPHRLLMLPGDTLLWEYPGSWAYRIPLRDVEVYAAVDSSCAGVRCRSGNCIREEMQGSTGAVRQLSWGFFRKVSDAGALLGFRAERDTELLERGEIALAELVASVAGATVQPAGGTAAERLTEALWNPARVLPLQGDTLVVVEDERWTYYIPLSAADVVAWSEYSQVGFRCRNAAECIRVSMGGSSIRFREMGFNVHASDRAAALKALHDIVRESGLSADP